MGVLTGLEPRKVFSFFEDICSIPHGSGNLKQISDYLAEFARSRHLRYRQDALYNVVIWKDASPGYEMAKPVLLQGHMDMVTVKTADCEKDLEKDGLTLELTGDRLSAKGTSLGGDDGIAVAMTLAVLDDPGLAHPPIEALFTVEEEIGMEGATFLDVSDLKGKMLINMDSEDEGYFTVSCAGGKRVDVCFPYEKESVQLCPLGVKIEGLAGGHSGMEIGKDHANANVLMGRLLFDVMEDIRLVSIRGGGKDNAIAVSCEAELAVPADRLEAVKQTIADTFAEAAKEYSVTDPEAALHFETGGAAVQTAMSSEVTAQVIRALILLPYGVQKMNPSIEGLVQTSLNLGILETTEEEVKVCYSTRSSVESEKRFLVRKIEALAECLGGRCETSGDYPGWQYREESRLRDVMVELYKEMYGKDPVVEGIHAGLECGIFAAKIEDLDAISIGPDMRYVHTAREELSVSSVKRFWEFLTRVLAALR